MFIIVNLHNRTGEGRIVKGGGVGGQTFRDKISLTIILFLVVEFLSKLIFAFVGTLVT